jgi:hypothetical protein
MLSLNHEEKLLLIEQLAPLGQVPRWDGKLTISETPARRFINDQTAVRQQPRSAALTEPQAYDPAYLGIGVFEALSTALIQRNYKLYVRLFNLVHDLDEHAAETIHTCEQAAVLLSHRSFGDELFPHIHARSAANRPTLSIFCNLTGTGTSTLTLYEPLKEGERAYRTGYTNHLVLAAASRKMKSTELVITGGQCVMFDAQHTPHRYSYGDDLWLTLVYDQADYRSWTGSTKTWVL